ncbi:isochorismatase family protein [Brevibacterium daeguense]|uniref:Isochorismatase family protein n=1 Tax=Brevibacterium daeguense TaxID=909936 RepID=A0ABP8EK63_9MICO|nr:isochorismatase family protein [Brevibacterium daeguense]
MSRPHLVVIDPQHIFASPDSAWGSPFFPEAFARIRELAPLFDGRVTVTRWLPTADRATAWGDYFREWPFADVAADNPLYDLVAGAAELSPHPPVEEPTFGKWGEALAARLGPEPHMVLTGVSTDCCVISTALAAADAGVRTLVVEDACAHSTAENGRAALHVMSLFGPQIELVTTAEVRRRLTA